MTDHDRHTPDPIDNRDTADSIDWLSVIVPLLLAALAIYLVYTHEPDERFGGSPVPSVVTDAQNDKKSPEKTENTTE